MRNAATDRTTVTKLEISFSISISTGVGYVPYFWFLLMIGFFVLTFKLSKKNSWILRDLVKAVDEIQYCDKEIEHGPGKKK